MDKLSRYIKKKNSEGLSIYSVENILANYMDYLKHYNITEDCDIEIEIHNYGIYFIVNCGTESIRFMSREMVDAITVDNTIICLTALDNTLYNDIQKSIVPYTKNHTNFTRVIIFANNYKQLFNILCGIHGLFKINYNDKLRIMVTNTEILFGKRIKFRKIGKTYFCNPNGMRKFEKNVKVNGKEYNVEITYDRLSGLNPTYPTCRIKLYKRPVGL